MLKYVNMCDHVRKLFPFYYYRKIYLHLKVSGSNFKEMSFVEISTFVDTTNDLKFSHSVSN